MHCTGSVRPLAAAIALVLLPLAAVGAEIYGGIGTTGGELGAAQALGTAFGVRVEGNVLRYRTDKTDDGLAGEEGAFTICSFWLVSALSEIGEVERARSLCRKLLSFAGPLGLYGEEIDPNSGRHLGNFPQAFGHPPGTDQRGVPRDHGRAAPAGTVAGRSAEDDRMPGRDAEQARLVQGQPDHLLDGVGVVPVVQQA